jgi:hypothetical protein
MEFKSPHAFPKNFTQIQIRVVLCLFLEEILCMGPFSCVHIWLPIFAMFWFFFSDQGMAMEAQ